MLLFKRKPAKIFAYETLIKYDISALPVPLKYQDDIKIFTMQFLAKYHHQNVSDYFDVMGYRGFVCYEPKYKNYVIFINGDDPEDVQRWSISIAIGLIESRSFRNGRSFSISEATKYIEDFTYTYTCPDCILLRDNITSAENIIASCGIPFSIAREKCKRLKTSFLYDTSSYKKIEDIICNLIVRTGSQTSSPSKSPKDV